MTSLKMEYSTFTLQLDRLYSLWNNAIHCKNFWVHTAGTYRATVILGRVHTTFFAYQCFNEMTNVPDEFVLARIMTALDLEFDRALHYHCEGYDSNNDYRLPGPVMRTVCIYLVSRTEASFNLINYNGAQCPISPFTPRWPRDELPFCQGVYQCLTFDETCPLENDSNDGGTISLHLTLITQYGLKSLYLITANNCASTRYHTILSDQQPQPHKPSSKMYPQSQNKWILDTG